MSAASKERRAKARAAARIGQKATQPWPERIPAAPNHVNVYTCPECKAETVTIDLHRGVTPALLGRTWARHRDGCKEQMARSSFYGPRPGHGKPTLEWYAPTRAEAGAEGPAMFDHARRGGLFVRRRAPTIPQGMERNG